MSSSYRRLVGPGYFVAAVLFLFPVIDLVANIWPFAPGRINWRYGAYVLTSGFVLTMLLGTALALLIGRAARHTRALRTLAVVNVLVGSTLAAAAVVFALDAMQLRAGVSDGRGQFDIGMAKALVKNTLAAVGFLWIGWVGWRRDRAAAAGRRADSSLVSAS